MRTLSFQKNFILIFLGCIGSQINNYDIFIYLTLRRYKLNYILWVFYNFFSCLLTCRRSLHVLDTNILLTIYKHLQIRSLEITSCHLYKSTFLNNYIIFPDMRAQTFIQAVNITSWLRASSSAIYYLCYFGDRLFSLRLCFLHTNKTRKNATYFLWLQLKLEQQCE